CNSDRDPVMCKLGIVQHAESLALFEESEIAERFGGLQSALKSLADSPGHKVIVLISAGVLVSDKAGGRPDVQGIGRLIGQSAAEASATIYALHFDRLRMDRMSA